MHNIQRALQKCLVCDLVLHLGAVMGIPAMLWNYTGIRVDLCPMSPTWFQLRHKCIRICEAARYFSKQA